MNILFPEGMMVQLIFGVQREKNQSRLYEMLTEAVGLRVSLFTKIFDEEIYLKYKFLNDVIF